MFRIPQQSIVINHGRRHRQNILKRNLSGRVVMNWKHLGNILNRKHYKLIEGEGFVHIGTRVAFRSFKNVTRLDLIVRDLIR